MKLKKLAVIVVSAVAAAGLLAACGGDKNAKFCELLSDDSVLDSLGTDDMDTDAVLKKLREVQAAAPDELKADIKTVVDGFEQLQGIDMTDPDQLQEFMDKVDTDKLQEASDNIDTKSETICNK
jgi:uncharacterized protein YpuA (DUF1002 family)